MSINKNVENAAEQGKSIERLGVGLLFISLAIIYFWFGGIKFTAGQGEGMYGMLANNPLVSWMYIFFSTGADGMTDAAGKTGMVYFLGSMEILIGFLILGRFVNPVISAIGGLLSTALFVVTLTMMVFLPAGVVTEAGFPVLSFLGEFLLKDIVMISTSIFIVGNSLKAMKANG